LINLTKNKNIKTSNIFCESIANICTYTSQALASQPWLPFYSYIHYSTIQITPLYWYAAAVGTLPEGVQDQSYVGSTTTMNYYTCQYGKCALWIF
jgi:hypothetical protein